MVETFKDKRILIVGDSMLDVYMSGTSLRLSPEAPVPVIENPKCTTGLGGAANVAANVKALGGEPLLMTFIGNDDNGDDLIQLLDSRDIEYRIISDPDRPTTCKTRIIGNQNQVCRLDREWTIPITHGIHNLFHIVSEFQPDCIVLSDYDKGMITAELIRDCLRYSKPIVADPKYRNFWCYKGVTIFKPNESELLEATKETGEGFEDCVTQAAARTQAETVLVTRGEKGARFVSWINDGVDIFEADIPAIPVEVSDVSGAGDTVTAVLALGLAARQEHFEIAQYANRVASISVQHHGCYAVSVKDFV